MGEDQIKIWKLNHKYSDLKINSKYKFDRAPTLGSTNTFLTR